MNRKVIVLLATVFAGLLVLGEAYQILTPAMPGVLSIPGSPILVTVDPKNPIGLNNLSLGFTLDSSYEWNGYVSRPIRRELARDAGFKLVRIFDYKNLRPCSYWDEPMRTGVCNWASIDGLVNAIFETGAEPMICLGASGSGGPQIPSGMAVNPGTNLPYPESFAAYAVEWVEHFKSTGLQVTYYEIWNEPWTYFGWDPVDFAKLANYMQFFDVVVTSMRRENPSLSISFDFIGRKPVLDYWLANGGADVDSIDFHKYDSDAIGQWTDAEMLLRAETYYFETWPLGYSIQEARRVWLNARGKLLPIINSEGNFNSAWKNGTDPRIQQMIGAVWTALTVDANLSFSSR